MGQAYSDPRRAKLPHALPDLEVFYADDLTDDETGEARGAGWYWWPCFPGCLPDGEASGPFDTEEEALDDARQGLDDDGPDPDPVPADVEYAVDDHSGNERTFADVKEASAFALSVAMARGSTVLDVLCWSEGGAMAYGGSDAVERYREDPDASVFERYEIKVNAVGRVS